jgi:argininosuccinate lyase
MTGVTAGAADTGRIGAVVRDEVRRIIFGDNANAAIDTELTAATEVDRAHLVMLCRRGILPTAAAAGVLEEITALRRTGFAALRDRPAPRGLFLLYENHLIETLGSAIGGNLHIGRSRNDLNATVLRLRIRPVYGRLMTELLTLIDTVIERAASFGDVVMPAYTHGQPAVPITFGHYLAGVATALLRDAAWLEAAAEDLDCSPLGAGAVGGTTVPIDPEITAELLGFTRVAGNSVDAVASRDIVIRILGAASVLGVTLSRPANDLFVWLTDEFRFLRLPDHLVGSSSMMPQKRNPYLLEHVKGRSSAAAGAFLAATMAMHATPFTNSVAVGTEGVTRFWSAVSDSTDAIVLLRSVLAEIEPDRAVMARRVSEGFTTATGYAEELARQGVLSFREAHHAVGEAVNDAIARGAGLDEVMAERFGTDAPPDMRYGGAAGTDSIPDLRRRGADLAGRLRKRRAYWETASIALDRADRQIRDRTA